MNFCLKDFISYVFLAAQCTLQNAAEIFCYLPLSLPLIIIQSSFGINELSHLRY